MGHNGFSNETEGTEQELMDKVVLLAHRIEGKIKKNKTKKTLEKHAVLSFEIKIKR